MCDADGHDTVIKWKHFSRYWPFVRGIHWSPVNSPHKGQWRGALMFSLTCAWINDWVNKCEAGDLRHHWAHYDVTVMGWSRNVESIRANLSHVNPFTTYNMFSIVLPHLEVFCNHVINPYLNKYAWEQFHPNSTLNSNVTDIIFNLVSSIISCIPTKNLRYVRNLYTKIYLI